MTARQGNQPCYKRREHALLLPLFRLGCVATSSPEGKGPSSRPVQQEIICSPFTKLLAGQSQGPKNTSSIYSPTDTIPRHARSQLGHQEGKPSCPPLPCSALRKAQFHLLSWGTKVTWMNFPWAIAGWNLPDFLWVWLREFVAPGDASFFSADERAFPMR